MMRASVLLLLTVVLPLGCLGCRGEETAPGSVTITSTAPFKNPRAMKSPPPKIPGQ